MRPYIPRNLHVPSDLLVGLIGPDRVVELLRSGQIERGVKDYHRKFGQVSQPVSAVKVQQAQEEFQRQLGLLDQDIREATHGSPNVS